MAYLPGTELKRSKYRVLGLIGQGQFGQVFCAVHRQTGRLVALKGLAHERFPTHKFLRELRFLLSLQHPNIVTCQALEHTATGRYLVMDYCEGGTLRNLMGEESRLTLAYSLKIVADVLAGLDHAHSRGIVHCDIKPENILMHVHTNGWTARISDFGIARLSQEVIRQNSNTGSPAYMAPERFYGQYSVASDLYSVGILLFELLAGYRPFSGTPAELRSAHLNAPLKLPDTIPLVWQPLIRQALQKLAARRFHSASEMLAAMRTIALSNPMNDQSAWIDLPTRRLPLFFTVAAPPECLFETQHQETLNQPTTALAVTSCQDATSVAQLPELTEVLFEVYLASNRQFQQLTGRLFSAEKPSAEEPTDEEQTAVSVTMASEPIKQLLMRPQGCFVIGSQSMQLNPGSTVGKHPTLQPVAAWNRESRVTVHASGRWLAALTLPSAAEKSNLTFQRLVKQPSFAVAAQPISLDLTTIESIESVQLLALDSRHVAVATTGQLVSTRSRQNSASGTTIRVFTRRGNLLGSLHLAMRLGPIILTANPYQLLATDADHAGTVLLIDLKPYRIKRLWVEISPVFLAVTDWGYILAEAAGRIVFVDYEGRQVGAINSPAEITAMTTVQRHGLLIATWNTDRGQLYSLDLRLLGLDLVF